MLLYSVAVRYVVGKCYVITVVCKYLHARVYNAASIILTAKIKFRKVEC